MHRIKVAKALLALADEIVSAEDEEEEEVVDEQFAAKVRALKTQMSKITQKKRRRLKQFGIEIIRPNSTVEDLVNALQKVVAT